ncbi:hypothetical protein [Foetidibacter luteolus]|uniref:hypothetical protein n=1 Tax=Foetidibacter luteolus TaxID=2608880 RepID=UPI00129B3DE5|nr:hypothetical protein [Foetidibacter luteolus]
MKRVLIIAGAITTLIAASCSKDKTNPGPGDGAAKTLKKVTKTEGETNTVYSLTYEGNRLTAMKSADNKEATLFTYDAAGNLTKIEEKDAGTKTIYTFTYNNNVPATGTLKHWMLTAGEPDDLTQDDELAYTVENDAVTKIHVKSKVDPAEADFVLSYNNGNLASIESGGDEPVKASFTYGNKKPLFPRLTKYVLDHAGFSLLFAAKNDMLSAAYDFPGTEFDYTVTNQYTYDANGNVLTSTDGTTKFTMEYQ